MRRLSDILDQVIEYHPGADLGLIQKAYVFSAKAHAGQERLSGEPYLSHPLEVAGLLADMRMDVASIVAGLLHDTVEDTVATLADLEESFGPEAAQIVDGVTKIGKMEFSSTAERQAGSIRKMILAMATDIRVILVKLADRLHNMRTLGHLSQEKQARIARETMDIYAPLAHRLGMHKIKSELEDLSFFYLMPKKYEEIATGVNRQRGQGAGLIRQAIEAIGPRMEEFGIACEMSGRAKHAYSVYTKMVEQKLSIDEVYDIMAIRIIVGSVRDCYACLGVIHSMYKPIPGKFKDYISLPKENGYQSLHTTVIGPEAARLEIQIRTREMHDYAENGVAAHWRYKENTRSRQSESERFVWLRSLLEWLQELNDPTEFLTSLKEDLFPHEVYVFTPGGDVRELPKGATPVDFAYSIHTEVGHSCTGSKVNGHIVPLTYKLNNGDTVEILTSKNHRPSKDWLNFVATPKAKNRIRQWYKTEEKERSITLGRELLEKGLRRHEIVFSQALKDGRLEEAAREFSLANAEDLIAGVGFGKISVGQVAGKLKPMDKEAPSLVGRLFKNMRRKPKEGIKVKGVDDVLVRFAGCCSPLPGEAIVGYITMGRGVTIHAADCVNARVLDTQRLVDVEWDQEHDPDQTYSIKLQVVTKDMKGALAELTQAISNANANIVQASVETTPDRKGISDFTLQVRDRDHLRQVVGNLKRVKVVEKVLRLN